MNLPSMPWLLGGAFALGAAIASVPAFKAGEAMQAKRDNAAISSSVKAAQDRATAAETALAEQRRIHKEEMDKRDEQERLASQLYDDARQHITATEQRLAAARKQLKELRNDPQARLFLDDPLPASVRRELCAARAEVCD